MGNIQNIPNLRFPEFKGEWEAKKLRELSDLITKGTTPNKFVSEGIKFIKIECFDGDRINPNKCLFIDENTHNKELKRSILKEGDILFAIAGATIGKVNIVSSEILPANTNQALAIVRLKENESRDFIYHNLKSNKMQKYIIDNISVGAQPNLNLEQMNNFSFFCSTTSEQTKIAKFLTAIDEKLQALKQKKNLLELYKKGMLQQIFLQELRFKDDNGNDFADWEEKKLGEVLIEHLNKNAENKYPEVFSVAKHKGVINQIEHLGRSFSAKEILHYKLIHPYDIVYTKSPTSEFPFGIIKQNMTNRTGVVSPLYGVFRPQTPELGFILHNYFNSWKNVYNYLSPLVQKGAKNTMNINNSDFLNGAKLSLPVSIEEQTKIANFLVTIDNKINHCQSQITKTEFWKKGLLQQIFV